MSSFSPTTFVFVHGAWHSSEVWRPVAAVLATHGHRCVLLDLPGAGQHALNPPAYTDRSLTSLSTEPSPSAHITQRERTDAVVEAVNAAAAQDRGPVVLVAHSYGGLTATHVVEQVPHLIAQVVYVVAFMLPPQWTFVQFQQEPCMAADMIKTVLVAPPPSIGALRVDWRCTEAPYIARCKQALAADVDHFTWSHLLSSYHCDEPLSTALEPSPATPARFGRVTRRYIRCMHDQAVVPDAQLRLIQRMDAAMGSKTLVDCLHTSHTCMIAATDAFAHLLMKVC